MKNHNPGPKIANKIEKSSKIGQGKKSLIPFFACLLTAISKLSFLEERLITGLWTIILDIKVRFSCGESDLYQNIVKFQNILTRIDWNFFFCSLHFQLWFKLLEKEIICLKNVSSINKLPIIKVERFLKSSFDLNQIC